MDITQIIDPLNPEQKEAVTAPAQNQLILAGAGSGKTRVLVHRIAYLLMTQQASGYNILAVTFTNKAARELKTRLENMVDDQSYGMWVGTFHGLCLRILKKHFEEAQLSSDFQILDSDDQLKLIRRIQKEKGYDENEFPVRKTQYFINAKKDAGLRSDQIPEEDNVYLNQVNALYKDYENLCQQRKCVDFGELLLRTFELLSTHENILHQYKQRFKFIFVDEFQDTNSLQYRWLKLLTHDNNSITVVGDDDQSIYSWRGALVENMFSFVKDFNNVHEIKLEQNYRSTPTILKAANALINHNSERLGKELWSQDNEGELIQLYNAFNEADEARFIIENIEQLNLKGIRYDQCAILYRSNAQSRILEEHLSRQGVPYRVYGGMRFFERQEIKDALAYLSISLNPHNDHALERIINTPPRGIGQATLTLIRDQAKTTNTSLWSSIEQLLKQTLLSSRAKKSLEQFLSLINSLSWNESSTIVHHCEAIVHSSGLKELYSQLPKQQSETKLENLEELINAIRAFESNQEGNNEQLREFLAYASLDHIETSNPNQHCVQLMTLHSAKGLEFNTVFLSGMEEDLFPHQMSQSSPKGIEEERRLCYVGMTRAMKTLVLTYAESRRIHGQERYQRISRFIHELPNELIQSIRKNSTNTPQPQQFKRKQPFTLGQHVSHQQFGEGVVLNYEEDDENSRIQIKFTHHGIKWLLCQYANIQTLS
ncbi:MAG TPA: DNA helicase II [Gammaproteobacteria bacterium]|nr:DNA helicase II [Gammaproteobacteria bacterium]